MIAVPSWRTASIGLASSLIYSGYFWICTFAQFVRIKAPVYNKPMLDFLLGKALFYFLNIIYQGFKTALLALPVWLLWNVTLVGFFPVSSLDFWRAWGLTLLGEVLFRGAPTPKWLSEAEEISRNLPELKSEEVSLPAPEPPKSSPVVLDQPPTPKRRPFNRRK